MFTLLGLLALEKRVRFCKITASLLFALASATRSNGTIYCGYLLYIQLREAVDLIQKFGLVRKIIIRVVVRCILTVICCCIVISPVMAFQFYAKSRFCNESLSFRQPYCQDLYPNVYGHVQDKYWNVGLFRYYTLKQIPNIALALPVLVLSFMGIIMYALHDIARFISAGILEPHSHHRQQQNPFFWSALLPYIYHWMFLVLICITVLHTQVSTRFLSVSPPLYWFGASLFSNGKTKVMSNNHAKLLTNLWILWCSIYIPVGTILFSNFFPWT
eukprot:TRINITY_DN6378_c0_g1_i1.p1 TRINITY_DN6378_c0_g1~~TRINITY_DN6378_c0_g1_i1.p1  ORF type:complete len:273 (-),score=43.69 TRINITY_DN6378_c0_g1_i1:197-1015(-)